MVKWKTLFTVFFYSVLVFSFSLYSYSQIDLNLTLSGNRQYQAVQTILINLGYFNRPLSAAIYAILLILMFVFFLWLLKLSTEKNFPFFRLVLVLICLNLIFAFISYPAFSHDFFNYLFDARIVTKYHLNPYQYKALDFPDDLWIRFMHWTHRTYPYGPLWLIITLPFSFLGFGKFVLTVLLFKLMFVITYLLNILLIWKIGSRLPENFRFKSVILYAFNPLILIESLVSPHNESIMLFFLLLSVFLYQVKGNRLLAIISLLVSVGVKFVTAIVLPLYLLKKLTGKFQLFFKISLFLLLIPLSLEIFYREAYPWYFIPFIGISAEIKSSFFTKIFIASSFGVLLRYIPYLYSGMYTDKGYLLANLLLILPVIIVISQSLLNTIIRKYN
ncbi:hypothetical protein A3D78_05610 [Candidatus Gottesmanbacteria bacterium RIFCSPHIGHO2_02_FULL_39_14]|uniref:Glycosyltransferase RgtA/B/C/D-like domain-containing protein n=1 Tax=Candidatus Gottesmanbacteria bacterium RIFCSPHIGHO2_02_FULL_39_14 TaxID=1798383 RepID=A0A1F5ZY65_9BACT|nr:MAG: hypothetical protein A3D78_05610 [Candidatus Gottesmanbacteria bacterium RIFCSPHIGHO2_02_FULL_39_14]